MVAWLTQLSDLIRKIRIFGIPRSICKSEVKDNISAAQRQKIKILVGRLDVFISVQAMLVRLIISYVNVSYN